MKIVVFNLRYGANLGDQLIAQCLQDELEAFDPSLDIVTEDLAGRDKPQVSQIDGGRMAALTFLTALPGSVRRVIAGRLLDRLVKKRLQPRWRLSLANADAVVIGGGGIFADSDLNFPKKISAALHVATERGLPVAIHAVGVSPGWSRQGKEIFGKNLAAARICAITIRDERARGAWEKELEGYRLPSSKIAPDPALTLASHLHLEPRAKRATKVIGLCLTSPVALRYHSFHGLPQHGIDKWYCELATTLTHRGYHVVGFTTGALEDRRFAKAIGPRFLDATSSTGRIAPPCPTASDLVALISQCDGLVSHRLHALIAAYTLGIPGLALAWEIKMTGQMEMMGYPDRIVDPAQLNPAQVADKIEAIVKDGIDMARRDMLAAAAHAATVSLVETLRAAVAGHGC